MIPKPYILFLPKWCPSRTDPLDGIFVKRHAKAVADYIDVCVLYVIFEANLKNGLYEKVEAVEDGILTVRYYYRKNITGISALDKVLKLILYSWCSLLGYKRICKIRGKKPLLTHVHVFLRPAVIAFFIKSLYGVKFIVTEHWTGYLSARNAYKSFFRKRITSWTARRASAIAPVSEALKKAMESHKIKSRYFIVPNVVDTEKFQYKNDAKNDIARILFVGSLIDEHKNISGMLKVMARLYAKRKDFRFVIIGTGKDEEKILSLTKSNKADSYVEFLGYIPNDELPAYLANGSFMIMFSRFEIQPTVLLEAMACGKPVIAPDVGGISEIINNKNGLLIKPNDENDLFDKINFMLDNYDKYDPREIRNYTVDNFSNKQVGKAFFDLYSDILELKKSDF
jgi:glycosyltransferase involved in cell wall biosynthesis